MEQPQLPQVPHLDEEKVGSAEQTVADDADVENTPKPLLLHVNTVQSLSSHHKSKDNRNDGFDVKHKDLINNECVEALHHRTKSGRHFSKSSLSGTLQEAIRRGQVPNVLDWTKTKNKERLKDLCSLIRNLFWAFTDAEVHCADEGSMNGRRSWLRRQAHLLVSHEGFSVFYLVLTIYALFGPDTAQAMGHIPQNPDDITLATINTVVLAFFVIEAILYCYTIDGYMFSGRFWVDCCAAVSIVGDTWLGFELIESDAAVAGRGSRLIRLVRVGGRTSRFVRLFRVVRTTQVLKLVPKLQDWLERDTGDLAMLLWHKRIWHILRCLDKSGEGRLTQENADLFQTAMAIEFPEQQADKDGKDSIVLTSNGLAKRMKALRARRWSLTRTNWQYSRGDLASMAESFSESAVGKRTFARCVEDIQSIKESCIIVEKAISRLTLKCCILVLVLLILTQLLEQGEEDISIEQGLHQLDIAASDSEVTSSMLCSSMIPEYKTAHEGATLLLLILHRHVFWNETCPCCGNDLEHNGLLISDEDPVADGGIADDVVRSTGLESHELRVEEVNDDDGIVRSLVVFDVSSFHRNHAIWSLLHTIMVVVLLMCLVVFFATDMKRLSNHNVLFPMWDLMDDMCALKSIEVLAEKTNDDKDPDAHIQFSPSFSAAALSAKFKGKQFRELKKCTMRWFKSCTARSPIPVADELTQLRKAFNKLHLAITSWSKFVPTTLLKQLFRAEVEAHIGCSYCEVSVWFCDIYQFKDMCDEMTPIETLELLEEVLDKIYQALEDNGGTMLEFIGDEVLAVFNAPLPLEQHTKCAVTAAVEAQELVKKITARDVRLACSVHKAQVLAGNLGSPTRMKYGVLGDGVNLTARLKSLNTRFGTQLLVSSEALDYPGAQEQLVARPIGKLVLKGRTTPTLTYEVLGRRKTAPPHIVRGAEAHSRAFQLFCGRRFSEAASLFAEAHKLLSPGLPASGMDSQKEEHEEEEKEQVSLHLLRLCEKYLEDPPPEAWCGEEHLQKKSWS